MDPDEIPKDADKKFICNDSFSDMSMSRHIGWKWRAENQSTRPVFNEIAQEDQDWYKQQGEFSAIF